VFSISQWFISQNELENKTHMKRISINYFLIFCLLTLSVNMVSAQKNDTIPKETIEIKSVYNPTVAEANKINENPEIVDSTKKIPVSKYGIQTKKMNTTFSVQPMAAAQMVGEPLNKLYNALVKVGMGTYTTPYGELWINSLRSKEFSGGLHAKHLSSNYTPSYSGKKLGYAGFSNDEIGVYGKKFLKKHTLIGNADYSSNIVHFYGFEKDSFPQLSKDSTKQQFNLVSANAQLKSHYTDPKQLNHDIRLDYYTLMDKFNTFENNFKASTVLQTAISKESLLINASVDYYNYKTTVDTVNNTIIKLNPSITGADKNYTYNLGMTAAVDIFNKEKYYFYPDFTFSYNIFEHIIVPYAGVVGGLQKNSYKSFTDVNPFVMSNLTMHNSDKQYEAYGGIKGMLSSTTSYNVRVSQQKLNNMAMFVNDTNGYKNKFDVIYDDATILTIHGEAAYQLREKIRFNLSGDYFDYQMKTEKKAWYKPQLKVALSGQYNISDKIIAKIDLFYIASQYAKIYAHDSTGIQVVKKELSYLVDVNVGAEYRYTKRLGFFINLNNLANMKYRRWYGYPTQGLSVMGGLSFSF
jgi:hypothetical protein